MKKKYLLFAVFVLTGLSLVISSCKSDNEKEEETTSSVTEKLSEIQSTIEETTGPDTIVISGMKYRPEHLTIHKGDTVVWINNDLVVHDVTEDTLQTWTSDSIHVGATWSMVPKNSFDYLCSIHPTMKGSITIVDK